ncbi:SDR family NAD(P)-dependent oxidoreductase [Haladaptatus sp. CMAA 1911]|uniref:SDR family NAD(P)-dependent oxidoreductase n=1 Tax=unclassified Haladaptatus TaxID=2622732 RepID=UPI003754DABC
MSDNELAGETAVITGASKGIGREIAEHFAVAGADVVICSREQGDIDEVAAEISDGGGGDALGIECDVTDSAAVEAMVDAALDEFGTVDVLVNNAGGMIRDDNLHRIDEDVFDRNIEVNLKGQYLVASELLPVMVENGGGSMVHMGSVNGIFGIGLTAYSAAKSGILSLSRNIATQYGRYGIRSNIVSPGTIETQNREDEMTETEERQGGGKTAREEWIDQYPLGRFGRPREIAEATLFLASDRGGFVSGTNLVVDGGLTAGLDSTFQTAIYDADDRPVRD